MRGVLPDLLQKKNERLLPILKTALLLESVHTIASMIMANKMNPENIISNLS